MNDQDLRDCFAMFILNGLVSRASSFEMEEVWQMADRMLQARNWKEEPKEVGIKTVKRTRKTND